MTQTATKPKEISLLLTPANRQAVRSGIKSQTRRVLKLKDPPIFLEGLKSFYEDGGGNWIGCTDDSPGHAAFIKRAYPNGEGIVCPYGRKGDHFYLLEPTQVVELSLEQAIVRYPDDGAIKTVDITPADLLKLQARKDYSKPCSSRFMLKSFARDWFVNDGVRVQRLQEISEEDAIAEGIEYIWDSDEETADYWLTKTGEDLRSHFHPSQPYRYRNYLNPEESNPDKFSWIKPILSFKTLWDSINRDRCPWSNNDWVWAIAFKRAEAIAQHYKDQGLVVDLQG